MSLLVPRPVRAAYFARRSRELQLGAIVSILAGAALLENAPSIAPSISHALSFWPALSSSFSDRPTLACFSILFTIAGIARAVSTYYLSLHIEPNDASRSHRSLTIRESVERLRHDGAWRLLATLLLFTFAMMIATPYWAAYVRQVGNASFLGWAGLLVIWYIGKAVALPWAGRIAQRRGRRTLLILSACLMAPIPSLWAITPHPIGLVLSHFSAGVAFGVWELAVMLALLDTFSDDERTSLLSLYNFGQWGAGTAGSLVGGSVLDRLPKDHGAFTAIFFTSSIFRVMVTLVLTRATQSRLSRHR
jgi:predicted MFS family arabinose efflux permease